jgi:uncharacterized protein (DUF1800 family)
MAEDGLAVGAVGAIALVAACGQKAAQKPAPKPAPATPLEGGATGADAAHLLSRLTFGAKPGQAAAITPDLAKWLDLQLRPQQIVDKAGVDALAPFQSALAGPEELRAAEEAMRDDGEKKGKIKREQILEIQMTAIARHVASERQLYEVIVDFWTNHFSVSLQKGPVRYLAADFVERAIRPHALGTFRDLLKATAHHPAMLVYLDNAQSVAPRPGTQAALKGRGLNENYARELLELHTLGVNGGYTQDDVIAVARILSGWSVSVQDAEFVFRARVHDTGTKTVMGKTFTSSGIREGEELLEWLATHPATIEHVCRRLCSRLVADDPPAAAIAAAAAAWRKSDGDIAEVVRGIVSDPAFWNARGGKIKSPLELVVSAVRAVNGGIDDVGLARTLGRLGQPLLLAPAPTGYADASDAWLSTAGALERMDVALAIASGRLPGVSVAIERVLPDEPPDATLNRLSDMIAGGLQPNTRAVIARWLAKPPNKQQGRMLALALTLASPEFQRQ